MPTLADAAGALESVAATGAPVEETATGGVARDPSGVEIQVRAVD